MRMRPAGAGVYGPASYLLRDRHGVTAVEYGIVAAFLCLSLLGIFTRFAAVLTTMFTGASSGI